MPSVVRLVQVDYVRDDERRFVRVEHMPFRVAAAVERATQKAQICCCCCAMTVHCVKEDLLMHYIDLLHTLRLDELEVESELSADAFEARRNYNLAGVEEHFTLDTNAFFDEPVDHQLSMLEATGVYDGSAVVIARLRV